MFRRRLLLFAGECYYPQGGALDMHGRFKTVEAAEEAALALAAAKGWNDWWWQAVDPKTWKLVAGDLVDDSLGSS